MPRKRPDSVSFNRMLNMTPEELHQVDPSNFTYVRAKDIAKFSEEQLLALHPEQIKVLKPISFSEVTPDLLKKLLHHLEKTTQEEQDVWKEKYTNSKGEEAEREIYGAKETIRRAIPKAEARIIEKEKIEQLRQQEEVLFDDVFEGGAIRAEVVAAKLNITMRYLMDLAHDGEIIMINRGGYLVTKQSVLDYLNRQRVPGAVFDEYGKPIPADKEIVLHAKQEPLSYTPAQLEPLTEIPLLNPVEDYADRLNMESRSFIRNCNLGFYDHFRIGTVLKMSDEDFKRSLLRVEEAVKRRSVGRTSNVIKKVSGSN